MHRLRQGASGGLGTAAFTTLMGLLQSGGGVWTWVQGLFFGQCLLRIENFCVRALLAD